MTKKYLNITLYRQDVGKRIYEIRNSLGLTLKDFGAQLEKKVNAGVVQKWERGVNLPNDERIIEIAQLGGVSVSWLLYGFDYANYQNHLLEDNFRELERFEYKLRDKNKTKLEIYNIQKNISQNLQETFKNSLERNTDYIPEFLNNPYVVLQNLINLRDDYNPDNEELTRFNSFFSLITTLASGQYTTPDTSDTIRSILDSLIWLSGNGPSVAYEDNDIFRKFFDKDGLESQINKSANNLHEQVDILAQKLKEKYIKAPNN